MVCLLLVALFTYPGCLWSGSSGSPSGSDSPGYLSPDHPHPRSATHTCSILSEMVTIHTCSILSELVTIHTCSILSELVTIHTCSILSELVTIHTCSIMSELVTIHTCSIMSEMVTIHTCSQCSNNPLFSVTISISFCHWFSRRWIIIMPIVLWIYTALHYYEYFLS